MVNDACKNTDVDDDVIVIERGERLKKSRSGISLSLRLAGAAFNSSDKPRYKGNTTTKLSSEPVTLTTDFLPPPFNTIPSLQEFGHKLVVKSLFQKAFVLLLLVLSPDIPTHRPVV